MKYKEIKETATILRRKITVSNKKIEELENEYKHHATIYNYLSHKLEVKEEELDSVKKLLDEERTMLKGRKRILEDLENR